jgi:hypothetical protein
LLGRGNLSVWDDLFVTSAKSQNTGSPVTTISFEYSRVNAAKRMADRGYLVRFKGGHPPPELVIAETIEFHGEHLVFLKSDGMLAALFLLEIVESWSEIEN